MTKNKISFLPISSEQGEEMKEICPINEYRIIEIQDAPACLPSGLVSKCHSVFVMASGSYDHGTAYFFADLIRPDYKDEAIDQEPFIFCYLDGCGLPSGFIIHHADYNGRTTKVPQTVLDGIQASGILQSLPSSILPNDASGSIYDSISPSQEESFQFAVERAKKEFGIG